MARTTTSATLARPGWADLPLPVRATVEYALGARITRSLRQAPEFAGGIAARLEDGSDPAGRWYFLKGVPAASPCVGNYRAEADITSRLPEGAPIPRLLSIVDDEWFVLVLSDIEGAGPKLRPGSPDLSATLAALGALHRSLTPCPIDTAPEALDDLGPLLRGWTELRARPPSDLDEWSARHLDSLAALETSWHPWAGGETLLHNDLSPDALVLTGPGKVLLTNWRYPARGAAWLDLVSLVPHILVAGHEPADVERLLRRRFALAEVPAWAVTGYAVALAGHAERTCRLPEPPGTSGVRASQRRLAAATRRWVAHRTRWH